MVFLNESKKKKKVNNRDWKQFKTAFKKFYCSESEQGIIMKYHTYSILRSNTFFYLPTHDRFNQ